MQAPVPRVRRRFLLAGLLIAAATCCLATERAAAQQWKAAWIQAPFSTERDGAELDGSRPMPVFRREFHLRQQPVKAELAIAGMGQYEAQLNGAKVGAGVLAQAWTDYRKTVTYDTYDVTSQLHAGDNAIGVMLGNGMYNVQRTKGRYTKFEGSYGPPKLTAELRVRYADGSREVIATDGQWQAAPGPIRFSSTYGGEDFDARRVPAGWDKTGDTVGGDDWQPAVLTQGPGGTMTVAIAPLVVEHEHYAGKSISMHGLAALPVVGQVYDFGQNIAGWPRIEVHGTAGAVVRLVPGELLNADGTVSQRSSAGPQWWSYTLRGDEHEVWQPRFSYYGFRYLQIEWTTGAGHLDKVESIAVHSASKPVGEFASSDEMLNRIHALIVHAMHNNEESLFTDCPHREKLGWLEETHLVAAGMLFNDDLRRLYRATVQNIADAQDASGLIPTIAPQYTKFGPKYAIYDDSPEWGSAAVLAPWAVYRFTGDRSALEQNYAVMQRYVRYLQSHAKDGIVAYGLGDWYDIGPKGPGFSQDTTLGVTGTLMLYEDVRAMSRIAALLGKSADAAQYGSLARKTAQAFQAQFWDASHGWYDTGSQTANAMPLALGIVPADDRAKVVEHVVADIHAHDDHTTAGEVGFPYLLRALHDAGRDDVVLAMAERTDPPSYGAQLAAGATALTEAWDANPRSSQDHFMLGALEEWFYGMLGGIDLDMSRAKPEQRITIRPGAVSGAGDTRVRYRSRLGEIAVARSGEGVMQNFDVTVPVRSTVVLPLFFAEQKVSLEDRGQLREAHSSHRDEHSATFVVPAGTWHFRMAPPRE